MATPGTFRRLQLLLAWMSLLGATRAAENPIAVEDFFKEPAFDEITISPDGSRVAALSTWNDHLNLYVIDLQTRHPSMLTGMKTMDVADVQWVGNDRLIFTGMEDGYPTGGLFAIDADGRNSRSLIKSARQQGNAGSWVYRGGSLLAHHGDSATEILVTSNERREFEPDVYLMNTRTGVKKMVARNPGNVSTRVPFATMRVTARPSMAISRCPLAAKPRNSP